MVTAHDFQTCALPIMGREEVSGSSDFGRAFVACFGMLANLCVFMCGMRLTMQHCPVVQMISHLLLVLLFLKVYME